MVPQGSPPKAGRKILSVILLGAEAKFGSNIGSREGGGGQVGGGGGGGGGGGAEFCFGGGGGSKGGWVGGAVGGTPLPQETLNC